MFWVVRHLASNREPLTSRYALFRGFFSRKFPPSRRAVIAAGGKVPLG